MAAEEGEGAELAKGYVSLGVRYSSAMGQIGKDFGTIEAQSKITGEKASKNLVESMSKSAPLAAMSWGQVFSGHVDKFAGEGAIQAADTFKGRFIQKLVAGGMENDFRNLGQRSGKSLVDGIGASISSLQGQNLDLKKSILNTSVAYENLKNSGTSSAREVALAHRDLNIMQNQQKANVLGLAQLHQQLGQARRIEGEESKRAAEPGIFNMSKLKSATSDATGALSQMGIQAGTTGGLMAGMGGGAMSLLSNPYVLAAAAVASLGIVVAGVTEKLYDLGKAWTQVGDDIEIQTGATGAKLTELKGDVEAVTGSVPLTIPKLTQLAIAASSAFGDTGQGVRSVITVLGDMESMVGKVDTTKLGLAFKGYGIAGNAPEQVAALEQIMNAYQQTQIPVDSLIGSFAKVSANAKVFGLSLGQTIVIMQQLATAGVDPNRVMFTLGAAAKNAQKNHEDFNTILGTTIQKIKDATTEQGKLDAAMELFGKSSGRGGASLIVEAVAGGLDVTPELLNKLSKVGPVIEKTRQDTEHWGEQWTMLKSQMSVALQPLGTAIFTSIEPELTKFATWVRAHKTEIIAFFGGVAKGGAVMAEGIAKGFSLVVQIIGEVEHVFGDAMKWLGDALADYGGMLTHIPGFQGLGHELEDAGHSMQKFSDKAITTGKKINEMGEHIQAAASGIIPGAFKAINDAMDGTKTAADGASDAVKAIPGAVLALSGIPKPKPIEVTVNAVPGTGVTLSPDQKSLAILMSEPGFTPSTPGETAPGSQVPALLPKIPGYTPSHGQKGLALSGYGGGDIVPAMLEPGEHVWDKDSVRGAGGHGVMYMLREMAKAGLLQAILGMAEGGSVHGLVHLAGHQMRQHSWVKERYDAVAPKPAHFGGGGEVDVVTLLQAESGRTPYQSGGYSPKGLDCSGLVAEAVEVFLGIPMSGSHPMATGNEGSWLAAHGFLPGMGSPGDFRVGFYNGGPGGGHTALTLPSGLNAESGGSGGGVRLGGGAAGAGDAEFKEHYYLPARSIVSPSAYGGTGSGGSGGYGGAGGAGGATAAIGAALGSGFGGGGNSGSGGNSAAAALFSSEGPQFYDAAFAHNRAFAKPSSSNYQTDLSPEQEQQFRAWVKDNKVPFDPDAKNIDYDMRGYWLAMNNGQVAKWAGGNTHFPDTFKTPFDTTFSAESQYATADNPFKWQGDNLIDTRNGQLIFGSPGGAAGDSGGGEKTVGTGSGSGKGQLGDIVGSGLKENMPPGFADPTSWGAVKSGAALFKFLGNTVKAQGGSGGASGALSLIGNLMGGSGSGAVADLMGMTEPGAFEPAGAAGLTDAGAGNLPVDLGSGAGAGGSLPFSPPGQPGKPDDGNDAFRGLHQVTNHQEVTNNGVLDHAKVMREITAGLHQGIRSFGLQRNDGG